MKKLSTLVLGVLLVPFLFSTVCGEQVVFSEIMYHPAEGLPEYIEIENLTSTPFDIANWRFTDGVTYEFPDFSAGDGQAKILQPFERILISPVDELSLRSAYAIPLGTRIFGPYTGALSNGGERLTLEDKNGTIRSTVDYGTGRRWPAAADGPGHSLVVMDKDRLNDDYRNWTFSSRRGGTPGFVEAVEAEEPFPNPEVNLSTGIPFVNYGDLWKVEDSGSDLGTVWKEVAYDDSGWREVTGIYGEESTTGGIPNPPGLTSGPSPYLRSTITYYFRKEFIYNGAVGAGVDLTIDHVVDDAAGYWLN